TVTAPARVEAGVRYPLVVDLGGTAAPPADAFLAVRTGTPIATGAEITAFMRTKYPIDPARISVATARPSPRAGVTGTASAGASPTRARSTAAPGS
ncbi:MAG TPA: hypothetical protein VN253_22910, partial [Kofleriaceae bacterium]|nr:hypothetical protein [Kofleriaceae bacterium]